MADQENKENKSSTGEEASPSTDKKLSQEEVPDNQDALSNSKIRNIERILDIDLDLTVKIGDLVMSLKEVLDLHSGSILEIDKNADAPLDLQIGNKILAQGEVVTVGENLGLRIIRK